MQTTPEIVQNKRQWYWFGRPKDSGRCPLDGGVNRSGHQTQIADNEMYATSFIEYRRGEDVPAKEPGYERLSTTNLGSRCGGVVDFTDSSGTNHLVTYHSGYLYEINETTGALTQINSAPLSPAMTVSNDGSDYQCLAAHTSSATDEPGTGVNWTTYWTLTGATGAYTAWALSTAYTVNGPNTDASLVKHGDSLVIAFGGRLYEWTGSGQPTPLTSSPEGASILAQFENRLYSNSSTAGVLRASNATYSGRNTWPSTYAFNMGRTGETINVLGAHDDFLLVFQDNHLDAFNPGNVMDASENDAWSVTLGCPSRYGYVNCGDWGSAYYTTEGIKFIPRWGLKPVTISNKITPDLEAIPANMRSSVALGWHDGRLRVAYADDGNTGGNNREFVCHLEDVLTSGGSPLEAVWTGPTTKYIAFYYTRLSNNGVKNELIWGDSRYGLIFRRTEDEYQTQDEDGNATDVTCEVYSKFAQLSPLGMHFWPKKAYMEVEGAGAFTLKAQPDDDGFASVSTLSASANTGFPYTFPITLTDGVIGAREINAHWPALTDVSAIAARMKYVALYMSEVSNKACKFLKLAVMGDVDGRVR